MQNLLNFFILILLHDARCQKNPQVNNLIIPLLIILLIISAFIIGILWTKVQYLKTPIDKQAALPNQPRVAETTTGKIKPVTDADHIRGNKNAKVTLVEYSDLECPFCKSFHPTMQQLLREYAGRVVWVYRHFPLDQIHPKADKEAEAAECAGELGGNEAFWAMVDKIFEVTPSNNGLNLDELPKLASQIGLDSNKFKSCLDSGKYAAHVEEDYQDGIRGGISGTPGTIVIDAKGETRLIPGALPYEQVKQIIEEALSG